MSDERNGAARVARHSSLATRHSRSGIALVITLILLSVTLVMAVAFLAIARRERNSVTTTTDTATARLATDSALAAAQAQIVANILSTTNPYNYSLLVSTNYISGVGYDTVAGANLTNVSYNYPNGNSIVGNDLIQNIANLYLLPRAPVFVYNRNTGTNDFRYYLDLNRNGQFETNNPPYTTAGDPEWIGILERPDQPHSPNNKFVARYAFFAQPVGNGLDLNFIHNQVLNPSSSMLANIAANDGYFRNEGVGTWELNLAAFLADLNTNQWNPPLGNYYQYNRATTGFANSGNAFYDAGSLLAWRYGNNFNTLATPWSGLLNALAKGNVDGYTLGPLMTTTVLPTPNSLTIAVGPWDASDNTNRFFALPSELFDATKSSSFFVNRLAAAGSTTNLYDRYTFYRMFDQLGTDSTVDDARMNLNYDNLDAAGNVIAGAETNCTAWTPLRFFTNAANVLLQHYTAKWATNYVVNGSGVYVPQLNQNYVNTFNTAAPFGVTHIPVLVSNVFVYTPAVNRVLQLAANMYDATTNDLYPHVFRPTFTVVNANGFRDVYIDGFREVSALPSFSIGTAPLDVPMDVTSPALVSDAAVAQANGNIYGVPWIIGAKKGLPNFNGFYMRPTVQVTRKLRVTRSNVAKPGATGTNEMFVMSITNQVGFSFWNSYKNDYVSSSGLTVYFSDTVETRLVETNAGAPFYPTFPSPAQNPALVQYQFTNSFNTWPGSAWGSGSPEGLLAATNSFITAVFDYQFLPESVYRFQNTSFDLSATAVSLWETNYVSPPVFPQFGLVTTNRVQAFILDGTHILDYVQLNGPNVSPDFNDRNFGLADLSGNAGYWNTNGYGVGTPPPASPTWGVVNQITTSRDSTKATGNNWVKPSDMPSALNTPAMESSFFNEFFVGGSVKGSNGKTYSNTNTPSSQAPYTPTRTFWQYTLWQVNDPLVHYLAGDLTTANNTAGPGRSDDSVVNRVPVPSLTDINTMGNRYQPWGRSLQMAMLGDTEVATNAYDLRFRDPLVWNSDGWDFPTGKLPNVGWLGRVHRGTPWQTVYLKQRDVMAEYLNYGPNIGQNIGTNTWAQWSGDTQNNFDAAISAPVSDRDLFDLFTATPSPNSTRGTLSVNQTHLASWSALFSGIVALTNATDVPSSTTTPVITNLVISPAGVDTANAAISYILNNTNSGFEGINATRAAFTNADGVVGAFEHVGDILNTLAYTEKSPFLTGVNPVDSSRLSYDISDELYEWLPQQTLGLLRASSTPRFVIYCYGQTLRPARDGLVTSSGNQFGLCTNYQVTAESAARVVLRVDNAKTSSPRIVIESFNALPPN